MSPLRMLSLICLLALAPCVPATEKEQPLTDKVIVLTVDAKGCAGIRGVRLATAAELRLHLERLFETESRIAKSPAELKRLLIHLQPDDAATYESVWATIDVWMHSRFDRLRLQLGKDLTKTVTKMLPEKPAAGPGKELPKVEPVDEPPPTEEAIVVALRAVTEGPQTGQIRSVSLRLAEEVEPTTLPAQDWQAALRKKLLQLRQGERKDLAVKLVPDGRLRWSGVAETAMIVDKAGCKTIHFVVPAKLLTPASKDVDPSVQDIDPNIDPDLPANFDVDRNAEVSVPGVVNPLPPIGIAGDPEKPPSPGAPPALRKDAVKDHTAFAEPNSAESKVYASLLLSASAADRAALVRTAKRDVSQVKLFASPELYRTQVIHVEGSLRRLRKLDPPKALAEKGRTALYEAWIYPERDAPPCCLVFLELPKGLEPGEHLEKRISFDAHFFKLVRYQSGQGQRYAPLFLGRSVEVATQPANPSDGGK